MKTKSILGHLASAALLAISIGSRAEASFIIDITQSGGNVVATGSGTINTAGLTSDGTNTGLDAVVYASHFGKGEIGLGSQPFDADKYTGFSTGVTFGSGGRHYATSGTGDGVVFIPTSGNLYVPEDYVSGSALSDTATWDSTTIALLGLTPGVYVDTWGSGSNADSLTVNIEGAPEPASVWLLCLGGIGLVMLRLRKRNHITAEPAQD
jgi:hypothetical protein